MYFSTKKFNGFWPLASGCWSIIEVSGVGCQETGRCLIGLIDEIVSFV
jgi:hypothetical protein